MTMQPQASFDPGISERTIDDWLLQQGYTASTVTGYRFHLRRLAAWLQASRIPIAELQGADFMRFMGSHPEWRNSMQRLTACAVKAYVRWHFGEDHPVLRVRVRRLEAGPQRTLSREEATQLLACMEARSGIGSCRGFVRATRDLALMSLMLDAGLRASEVCRLELGHLDLARHRFHVLQKGQTWREGVFSGTTAGRLERWLHFRPRRALRTCRTVFCGLGGHKPGTSLTRDGLRAIFRDWGAEAGLEMLLTPHVLRRSMAVLAIENGAPTRLVQVQGGWKTLEMVEHYSRALRPDAFERYSPVAAIAQDESARASAMADARVSVETLDNRPGWS